MSKFQSEDVLLVDYGAQQRQFIAVDALLSDELYDDMGAFHGGEARALVRDLIARVGGDPE